MLQAKAIVCHASLLLSIAAIAMPIAFAPGRPASRLDGDESSRDAILGAAQKALAAGRFADATARLEPFVARCPDDPLARCLLAFALVSQGDGTAALVHADAAAALAPTAASPRYQRGRALLLAHDFAGADAAFSQARALEPGWEAAWRDHFHALAALGTGDEPRAVELFSGSPESLPPAGPPFLFERFAMLWPITPDPEPARTWYRRAASDWFDAETPGRVVPAFDLAPPVRGEWRVMQGNYGDESHFGIAGSHAFDLMKIVRGRLSERDGDDHATAYFTFGEEVIAPAAGRIRRAVGDLPDHAARAGDRSPLSDDAVVRAPLGNHVVIELAPDAFLLLAHLRQGTLAVKAGDTVSAGKRIGVIGMSGVTWAPHLHLALWSQLEPPAGRPLRFRDSRRRRTDGTLAPHAPFTPETGESIVSK
jgi:tetratricopeptide (TPR) repeat protein